MLEQQQISQDDGRSIYLDGGARTTKYDKPLCIAYSEKFANLTDAKKREQQIKKLAKPKNKQLNHPLSH